MWRLSNEGILVSMGASSVECFDCGMSVAKFQIAIKAQLKKVYEEGDKKCPHGTTTGLTDNVGLQKKRECRSCWEELLKEVNNDF